jgi:hypothetical protein
MGVMSDPNLTLTEEIKNREHNLITVYRLPKKNRDKMVSFFKNATLCLKDVEF